MTAKAISISKAGIEPENYEAEAAKVIAGSSAQSVWNGYSDKSEQFHCGIWEGAVGKWRVNYTEEEFCLLLEGRVVLTNATGEAQSFEKGDAFVVPAGFDGIWENFEPARKYYAIFEKADG